MIEELSSEFLARINPQLCRVGYTRTPGCWLDAPRLDYQTWFMALEPGMEMSLELDGRSVELAGGQGLLVKPGTWVARRVAGKGTRRFWVGFDWDVGHARLAAGEPAQVYAAAGMEEGRLRPAPGWVPEALWGRPLGLPGDFFEHFLVMNNRFGTGGAAGRVTARGLWLELLLKVLAPCCRWEERGSVPEHLPEVVLMEMLRTAAAVPFKRAPQVQALLARTGQSPDHVARRFRRAYGVTPLAYLNRLRVEQAKALLEQPGLGVSEVARRLGFGDFRYLSRLVRRVDGRSPREIRRAARR